MKKLTARQLTVIAASSQGVTREEMAARLGVRLHSITMTANRAAKRLGARSLGHAIGICFRRGLIK